MFYFWFSNSTSKTARLMADRLHMRHGSRVPPEGTTKCICWGNSMPRLKRSTHRRLTDGSIEFINNPFKVRENADKFKAMRKMHEHGVSVPPSCTAEEFRARERTGVPGMRLPIVGRTRTHQGGSGFFYCETLDDMRRALRSGAHHFMNYIDKVDEFRVHVFQGEVVRISRKIPNPEETRHNDRIRSHNRGWIFEDWRIKGKRLERPNRYIPEAQQQTCIDAVSAVGLDFGAVDIVVDANETAYVLEVNSGPSLNLYGRRLYQRQFKSIGYYIEPDEG